MQKKKKIKKITVFLNENSNQSFWLPISFEMLIIMVTVLVKVRNYLKCVILFFRLFFFFNHCSSTAAHAQGNKTVWLITPMEAIQVFTK